MIKLKQILLEGMNKKAMMDIVNKVYPHIVRDLGGSPCKVEIHNNICFLRNSDLIIAHRRKHSHLVFS